MYIKRNMSWGLILRMSWRTTVLYSLYSLAIFGLYHFADWDFINVPFEPISVIGIAVAFYLGFKNSQSYDRFWEGRKIWGRVVNYSRTWGALVISYIESGDKEADHKIHQEMIYRHIAWLNALRVQLRQPTTWAVKESREVARLHSRHGERSPSWEETRNFVTPAEYQDLEKRVNVAAHLVKNQAKAISALRRDGSIDGLQELKLQEIVEELYNLQGMSERIKNTPFPRQYGYFGYLFTIIFILLVPFGLLDVFESDFALMDEGMMNWYLLLMIPFSALIAWIFHTMDAIGDNSEDPFEGRMNDVPLTALCRTIEIDLRDMLDETDLPPKVEPKDDILY